jgi:hypothetical protein
MNCAKRKTAWLVAKAEFGTGSSPGQGELRSQDGGTHNAMWREATIKPTLNALSQHKIANDHGTQCRQKGQWQRDETEPAADRGIGQQDSNCRNDE